MLSNWKKKSVITHVLLLFEPLLRIQLNPGYFSSIGSAAWLLLTFTWVPASPDVYHLIFSISSPLLGCFYSFLGLVNASSVGQERHCSSLNLHYLNTVGQDFVFLQCKSRVESSAIALWVWCGAVAKHLPKIRILPHPEKNTTGPHGRLDLTSTVTQALDSTLSTLIPVFSRLGCRRGYLFKIQKWRNRNGGRNWKHCKPKLNQKTDKVIIICIFVLLESHCL